MLYKLISSTDNNLIASEVISLTDIGLIGGKIKALGVPVYALGMHSGSPNPLKIMKLANWLRQSNPDIIQTWMYHADLIGGIAAKLAGRIPVIWGIHHYNLDRKHNKRSTIWTAKISAMLSRWLPEKIVCCSQATREVHEDLGYVSKKMVVIPNGIDLSVFKPDPLASSNIRKELGISLGVPLIGMVARFSAQKDHCNFVEAAGLLHAKNPVVHFLLCGSDVSWDNQKLVNWIAAAGVSDCFHLLGTRQDVETVTAALDIATLSSFGESFSLMIGEAMACRVPCVTTDIAAPVELLGGNGWVVPIHDARSLCNAWQEILNTPADDVEKRLDAAKQRIQKYFSLDSMVGKYRRVFEDTCKVNKK